MYPPLPEYPAHTYALHLQQLLLKNGVVDFEGEGKVPINGFFLPGGGGMFGVLVARDQNGNEVLLKAFSGSCMGHLNLPGWVDHLVDEESYHEYLRMFDAPIKEIGRLAEAASSEQERRLHLTTRSELSRMALSYYRELYRIATLEGNRVRLESIFPGGKAPTGSGDCCAIKLLQYAFTRQLHPISMAEFFFGAPTKDSGRSHLSFYGPCDEKCKPILHAMLTLDIIYQDSHIIIVNKDAGLLSVPGRGPQKIDSVETRLRKLMPNLPLQCAVHRLDMDTSGLLILAKDKETHKRMNKQFSEKQVIKSYVALLEGVVRQEKGEISLPFRLDAEHRPLQVYDEQQGKWGTTRFQRVRVERRSDGSLATRMLFFPLTGRTHQLRVHSAHGKGLGHPIKGDRLYGSGMSDRLYLHAKTLSFHHPITGVWMEFSTEDPF
ncbi:MAG: RluA family pseudouridine synthase [Sphaerochaeta sp.]|uniref:RluA family pseudouridine synthase n=1 Tax=Sphaerochaeta sp. TaxID=1972642 RepID=UPI003D0F4E59